MPERKRTRRIDTASVQSEGSYVVMRRMLVGEIKAARRRAAENPEMLAVEISSEMLAEHVVEWNWVDDEGQPLPEPLGNEAIFDQLSDEEFELLSEELIGVKTRKN